ncbi:hypothetical protein J7643_12445 [bacterium]|nr:hypothetical protein [bacterium]
MSNLVGPGNSPHRPQWAHSAPRPHERSKRPDPQGSRPQRHPDGLSLSATASALSSGEATQALALLKRLTERPGGILKDADGHTLTPDQALEHLANGQEVVARVSPEGGKTRSASALLFAIEDIRPMAMRLAQA